MSRRNFESKPGPYPNLCCRATSATKDVVGEDGSSPHRDEIPVGAARESIDPLTPLDELFAKSLELTARLGISEEHLISERSYDSVAIDGHIRGRAPLL